MALRALIIEVTSNILRDNVLLSNYKIANHKF